MYHITGIEVLNNYHLRLSFDDGETGIIDMNKTIEIGGIFSKLADSVFFHTFK
jgi:DUF971 family protein